MLVGQDFRRSHQAGLIMIVQSHEHAHHCNQGFAAADISLEKPVHLLSAAAILPDFFNDSFLGICEGKGEILMVKRIEIISDEWERTALESDFPFIL